MFQVNFEAVHGDPEKHSYIAVDDVRFIETEACDLYPVEAVPQPPTTTTTLMPTTLPSDRMSLNIIDLGTSCHFACLFSNCEM